MTAGYTRRANAGREGLSMSDELELVQGHVYSAKRPQLVGIFDRRWNDRQILRLWEKTLQYDSPTIQDGRKYPTVTREQFLHWAKEDVTEQTPEGDWRPAP